MGLPWRSLAGFSLLPFAAAISPLLLLPLLVRTVGADGWAAIAIGMSVGGAAAIFVNYGWGVSGPASVAPVDDAQALEIYRTSFIMRLGISVVIAPVSYAVAAMATPGGFGEAAGMTAVAYAAGGLSPAWFFIGRSSALGVARWDTVPRLLAAAACIPFLLWTPDPAVFALSQLSITAGAWIWFGALVLVRCGNFSWGAEVARIRVAVRDQSAIVGSSAVSGLYTSLAVTLVAAAGAGPASVATFAAADRVRAMGKQAEMAVCNGLQGWVGRATIASGDRRRNGAVAMMLMSAVGLVGALALAVLLPVLSPLLFDGELAIGFYESVPMGIALLMTAISMSATFHVFAPTGRLTVVAAATTVGAVVGAPLIFLGAGAYGPSGAAVGLAIAEALVVAIELPLAVRVLRRLPRRS